MQIIIADHTLHDFEGHSFEYCRSIREQALKLGHETTILALKRVSQEVIAEIDAIPCFRYGIYTQFNLPYVTQLLPYRLSERLHQEWNFHRHLQTMKFDITQLEKRLPLNRDNLVLVPTPGFNDILPFVKWAESLPHHRCPRFALIFHFTARPDFTTPYGWSRFYKRAFRRLENSPVCDRFRLFTDSVELATEYRAYTSLPVEVVPVPHAETGISASSGASRTPSDGAPRPLRLSYIGDARETKGFHLLPFVLNRLEKDLSSGVLEAEIQANVRNPSEWQVVFASRRLRQLPNVKMHDKPLTTSEYFGLIDRAHIVVLPYSINRYHSQTSGIFTEALAKGKPVVVPRGTWMARQLKENGAGVTFLPEDRQSLLEAVETAVSKYDELQKQAQETAPRWASYHNPVSYLKQVLGSLES